MVLWENVTVKTTLELPDGLMRAVKLRAAHSNRRLKDVMVELLERGLSGPTAEAAKRKLPEAVRLSNCGPLTTEEIESAINNSRD